MIGEVKFCKQFSTNGFSSGPIECDDFFIFFLYNEPVFADFRPRSDVLG